MISSINTNITLGPTNDGDDKTAIIIGSVVASVIVVIIISTVVFAITFKRWRKRRNEEKQKEFLNRLKDYNEISVMSDSAEANSAYSNKSYVEDGFENSADNLETRKSDSRNVEKDAKNDNGSQKRTVKLSDKRTGLKNANAYAIVSIYTSSDKSKELTGIDKGSEDSNLSSDHSLPDSALSNGMAINNDSETMGNSNLSAVSKSGDRGSKENNQGPIYYELEKVVDEFED